MDNNPPPESKESSFIKRFLEFVGVPCSPDTHEDLEQEIQVLVDEGEESGLITSHEGRMISNIFDLRDTLAREIMTPRTEMVCAPDTASAADIMRLITEKGFTRIPIYSESPDNIVGVLHAKDLLAYFAVDSVPPQAGEMASPAYFALETQKILNLLKGFQARQFHLAIVTDEFGGVRGLVTLEDVLEEIVGEIDDEYDKPEFDWDEIDPNTLMIAAKVNIEDVESYFDIKLPEGPCESVGGLIIHQLGRLPETGTTVELAPLTFEVISATRRRIISVKIHKSIEKSRIDDQKSSGRD
ncbi:MAG: hemolysin family protein [Thermodesulfobacteriota bacterium]|nr:hemolysin family protein [Thermodesulfobacteriota bacterium]